MVLTEKTNRQKGCGFRNGLNQVRMGDYKTVVAELYRALGIKNRNSFYAYRDGAIELRVTQAEAVEGVFNRFGITDIWGA